MKPDICVVIPAYNSALTLPELTRQLEQVLAATAARSEIILVDDGSTDDTWPVICDLCASHPAVRGIRLMKNSGQANATVCGLEHADCDIVVTMDDDLQHRPEHLPQLVDTLLAHPDTDCVFGVFERKHHAAYRNLGSRIINQINRAAFRLPQDTRSSGFRVMNRSLVKQILAQKTANPSLAVLIMGCTGNVRSVTIPHARRFKGRSNYTLAKQLRLAFDNICNATVAPLRFVSGAGVAFCFIAAGLGLYYLYRYATGHIGIQGWTTLVLLITFFSGMILLSLGIIGEYLVRVLREVSHAPPYMVRQTVNMPPGGRISQKPEENRLEKTAP